MNGEVRKEKWALNGERTARSEGLNVGRNEGSKVLKGERKERGEKGGK